MIFCINCDNEAIWFYLNEDNIPIGLCESCSEAFRLGQVNSETVLIPGDDLSQYILDDEEEVSTEQSADLSTEEKPN
jgi:hypothetical protein